MPSSSCPRRGNQDSILTVQWQFPGDLQFGNTSRRQSQLSSDSRLDGATCWRNGKSSLWPQHQRALLPVAPCPGPCLPPLSQPWPERSLQQKARARDTGVHLWIFHWISQHTVHFCICPAFFFLLLRALTVLPDHPHCHSVVRDSNSSNSLNLSSLIYYDAGLL